MSDGGANLTGVAAIIAATGSFLIGLGTAVSSIVSAMRRGNGYDRRTERKRDNGRRRRRSDDTE